MSTQVDAMMRESGLDPIESEKLAALLGMLDSLADESAPAPSDALAAMLAGGATGAGAAVVRLTVRRHQNALAAAVLAVTGIVATGVAAAANDLPPTAQRIVAEFSDRFLPFDFPQPEERAENLDGDPDGGGGPAAGADDGEARGSVQDDGAGQEPSARDSGDVTSESETRHDESGTQVNASDGDDHESDDGGPREQQGVDGDDSDDSSSGDTADQTEDATTSTSASGDGDGSADTSGESDGDDSEQDGD